MPTLAHPQSRPQAQSAEPAPEQGRAGGSPAASATSSILPLFLQRLPVPEVQAKLLVNEPNDAFEQEADSLSESVAQGAQGTRPPSPRPADASQDLLQRKPAAPLVDPPVIKPPDGGSSLDGDVRTRVEPLLGMDLSSVRVHDSPSARDTADTLRARAFTHRDHIWLGPGESRTDERLIAHELTHVAQQSRGATPAVQRAPADYRHAEDGAEPHRRMQAKLREELGDDVEVPSARRPEGEPGASGAAPAPAAAEHEPIDRGQVNAERAALEPQAHPNVDRAAEERPRVEASAEETQAAVDAPPVGGEDGAGAGNGEAPKSPAETAIEAPGLAAEQAFAAAESVPPPVVLPPVEPIPQVAPVDAAGRALPPVPGADEAVIEIAQATQSMRDEGTGLQEVASGERKNTGIMEGNMNLVRQGIAQADLGVTSSEEHAQYRGGVVDQARAALDVSREKTAMVAEHAPRMSEKADEGRSDSEGVNREATDLNGEASANTPDDEEAAERAREQQGETNRAGGDISNIDHAFEGSQERSRGLAADAAQAADLNAQADAKMQESTAMLERTRDRLGRMRAETDGALAQVEGLADQPALINQQTDALDATGIELVEQSFAVEERLRTEQETHQQNSAAIPELPEGAEVEGDAAAGVDMLPPIVPEAAVPETVEPMEVAGLGGTAGAGGGAAKAAGGEGEEAGPGPGSVQEPDEKVLPPIPAALPGDAVVQRQPQAGYEDRYSVDLASPIAGAIPTLLGGTSGAETQSREEHEQAEQARRAQEILDIQQMAGKPFEQLSSWERQKIGVRMALRHLGTSLGGIRFPGWGALAIGLINPVTPLLGVVSGLSMLISGAANIFNIEAWRRDWLGNLLKIAADIATGLTIILGSITALAAVIAALCTVLIFVTLGALAPVLGPVVAFCSSVMVTVGGWTIAVGQFALLFQLLVFIKNLYEAGVARNAAELQRSSDRMSTDISSAGNVVLQMGMAKLAQIGGRQMQASIARAGGGAAWAGGLNTRVGGAFQSARVSAAGAFGGARAAVSEAYAARGVLGAARTVGGGVVRGGAWTVTAPFRAARGLYRGLSAPLPEAPANPFGRGFLVGENAGPGMAGARAAALEGQAMAQETRTAAERAQLQATIEALRTPTGAVDPAARARLLAQLPTVQATTAAQVEDLAARMLNIPREQITSRLIGEGGVVGQQGATGARVHIIFNTPPGGTPTPISAVKIFPSTAGQVNEFAGELSALDRLNQIPEIPGQGVVSTQGAARTAAGEGVLLMTAAPGESIDDLMIAFGRGEVPLEVVTTAFRREGEALARLHMATASATAPSAAATAEMIGDLETQFAQLQQRVASSSNPEVAALSAEMGAAEQRVGPLITGVEQHPGASTIVHGDFHPGNVFYDRASGRITFIDASRVHQSIDQAGQAILSPARDVATGRASIEVFASNPNYGVTAPQRAQFQAAFSEGYANTVAQNAFTPEALAFHQARYAVRRLLDSLAAEGGVHGLRLPGAINEFRAAFGLPPVAPPPPAVPSSVP